MRRQQGRPQQMRAVTADEVAAEFVKGLPLEEQLQASVAWVERKRNVNKKLIGESQAAQLLNQGLMQLEQDRAQIVALMAHELEAIKVANKRLAELKAKLAAHDKMAAPFVTRPAGRKKPKRASARAKAAAAAADHTAEHEAAYDAVDLKQSLVQP